MASGIVARQAVDPPFQFIDLAADGGDGIVARRRRRGARIVRGPGAVRGRRLRLSGRNILVGRLDDERVQPGADRDSRAPGGLARDLPRVGMNPFDVPRHGSHARSGVFGFGRTSYKDYTGAVRLDAAWTRAARHTRTFPGLG